ncbi:hypothetical protein [Photobacterium sanguinicancri]|uniref:hypothetical protein n=1 Tax=Photobacterium sanguinicancri TaxID=875932 RepID=UPI0021C38270|nr:hypothetical protein [Photobacterium sanguinicancri]
MPIHDGYKSLSLKASCLMSLMFGTLTVSGWATAGEFDPKSNAVVGCPGAMFTQQARIFDAVTICATEKVAVDKLHYAANVTAKWLDNNDDGIVDEPALLPALRQQGAMLLMSEEGFSDKAFDILMPQLETRIGQDLAANETAPMIGRDASQEEIHHLIVNAGWQFVYPEIFSSQQDQASLLYKQWEKAEAAGYYDYGDPTCDDECKTVEFFYLATAAYLGSDADLESDEMRVKDRRSLRQRLPGIVALMESPDYHYPTHIWPDGKYQHSSHIRYYGIDDFNVSK